MRRTVMGLALAAGMLPMALAAKAPMADKREMPEAQAMKEQGQGDGWGQRLPEALKVTFWNSKEGEANAASLSTSRENFGVIFEMGKSRKAGLRLELKGEVTPVGGGYELKVNGKLEGGDDSKGGIGLKLRCSTLVKKGESAVLASSKDGKIMVRLD